MWDCFRYPTRCCQAKYTEPTLPDECRCGRGASNGLAQVLLTQLFLFAGLWLSGATLGDCNLINIDDPIMVRPDNVTTTSLGMLSYLDPDTNRCYFWWDDNVVVDGSTSVKDENGNEITAIYTSTTWTGNDQLNWYMNDVLGEDWYVAMGFSMVAYGLSILLFLYGISYYCSTQVKACRCFAGCLAGVCLPLCQGLGMMFVYTSEWCANEGCTIGRTTYFSIAAAVCFFIAGINFWMMEHWPGQTILDEIDEDRGWETGDKKKRKMKKNQRHSRDSHSYARKEPKRKTRSFSGDAWVMEVEKSAAETSRDDIEDGPSQELEEEYDEAPTSRVDSVGAPSSFHTAPRSDKYSDEPQSPMTPDGRTRRISSSSSKPKRNSYNGDPNGYVGDRTSSTHMESVNPTTND